MGRRDDDDDDRLRKSWREIDKQRDSSAHHGRKDEPGAARQAHLQRSVAYRQYKTQLDKIFDGGGLPDALKSKLEESGVGKQAKARKAALDELLAARTPKTIRAALASYREEFGFPDAPDALAKLLDLDDAPIVVEALQTIDRLHDEGALARTSSLKGRIKTAQMTVDDDDVAELAAALLKKI